MKTEISEKIVKNDFDRKADPETKNYEVEYFYVDFQHLIIGEKIRAIANAKDGEDPEFESFDDLYYSRYLADKADDEINNSFFK